MPLNSNRSGLLEHCVYIVNMANVESGCEAKRNETKRRERYYCMAVLVWVVVVDTSKRV